MHIYIRTLHLLREKEDPNVLSWTSGKYKPRELSWFLEVRRGQAFPLQKGSTESYGWSVLLP